jgi:hypothetical protein
VAATKAAAEAEVWKKMLGHSEGRQVMGLFHLKAKLLGDG